MSTSSLLRVMNCGPRPSEQSSSFQLTASQLKPRKLPLILLLLIVRFRPLAHIERAGEKQINLKTCEFVTGTKSALF